LDSWEILVGFILYFGATAFAALFVAPYLSFLLLWFGFMGALAGFFAGALISFPILILFFYLAHRVGLEAGIPEAQ